MCRGHPKMITIINKPSESVNIQISMLRRGVSPIIDYRVKCHFSVGDKNDRKVMLTQPYSLPTRLPISPMIVLIKWRCLGRAAGTSALYMTR